jgi:putative membrane protein
MRTFPAAALIAISLAACDHEQTPKTAYQPPSPASSPATPPPAADTAAANTTESNRGGALTTADVPHEGPNAGNPVAVERGATEAQADMLTDEQILQIAHTADLGEIAQAKLALSKSKDPAVRKLAQMMVRDHTQSDNKGAVVAKKNDLTLAPSSASDSIKSDVEDSTRTLRTEAPADFAKDYVATQIREHQALLDTLDQKLIADAKSADVKAYLVEVRAAVASHLEHAKALQTELTR